MAKITNIRERVHQPLRDALIRTSGNYVSNVQDRTDLFTVAGGDQGRTNLQNGSTLPSDQSMVVLALRTFLWFRNPQLRAEDAAGNITVNGDILPADFVANQNTGIGSAEDVHRLYFQASEQLLWSVGAGQKYSLTSMPSAYFPYAGGLHGRLPKASGGECCIAEFLAHPPPLYSGPVPPDPYVTISRPIPMTVAPGACCPSAGMWASVWVGIELGPSYVVYVDVYQGTVNDYVSSTFIGNGYVSYVSLDDVPNVATVEISNTNMIPAIPTCYKFTVSDVRRWMSTEPQKPNRGVYVFYAATCDNTLIHWNNGTPEASSLTRLARAILIPPRQNILVSAQIVSYADNPQSSVATQGSRNLLSLTSNLNQQDYINKCITMTLDGLLSRDVQ